MDTMLMFVIMGLVCRLKALVLETSRKKKTASMKIRLRYCEKFTP